MSDRLNGLQARLEEFRDERDWAQFHSLKNLIAALSVEAGELLELTLWQKEEALEDALQDEAVAERLQHECSDVLAYLLLIASRADFDLIAATERKLEINRAKYPVEKARGSAVKYDKL
jgi:NTP pyrophosphatase (non-canonical NTP hydrolase)